ncbi:MAG: hypothetical protein A4E31_00853 [Methanomassiliicoccales archaeon PtaU1.Bin030]|nr:MAG: hypothetical protein A4E31_00853 [Methanomassiliicoccales archaeon PtaU1.Bin030]
MSWSWGKRKANTYPMLETLDLTRVCALLAPEFGCTDIVIQEFNVESADDGVLVALKLKIVGW